MAAHRIWSSVLALVLVSQILSSAALAAPRAAPALPAPAAPLPGWVWPAESVRVVVPYAAPAHRYGPGHRGIDLALEGTISLRAPAGGVVAFSGTVVDRT